MDYKLKFLPYRQSRVGGTKKTCLATARQISWRLGIHMGCSQVVRHRIAMQILISRVRIPSSHLLCRSGGKADTPDLDSGVERRAGSSPAFGIKRH